MNEKKSPYIFSRPMYISRRRKRIFIIKFIIAIGLLINIFFAVEKRIIPPIIEISKIEAKQIANSVIDKCVRISIEGKGLKSSDFFSPAGNEGSISANTMLINELCTAANESINKEMIAMEKRKVYIPLGAATGIEAFSNTGPDIGFKIRQMGHADVDYETEFSSAGINQTNYKVYLTVKLDIKMVNPLGSSTVETTRKVMLIDTIIEGKVPSNYLNFK